MTWASTGGVAHLFEGGGRAKHASLLVQRYSHRMTLSAGTQGAVQSLWAVGARYGREVRPSAGADLLEDDDPLNPQDGTTVELIGVPAIAVRLFGDLSDIVIIDDMIEFEVPRNDTLAVVEVVLSGNARLRRDASTRWSAVRSMFLAPFVPYAAIVGYVLVIRVPGGACYEESVPVRPLGGGAWLSKLSSE